MVRGALPDDLGFAVERQVIWYFLQGSPGNQPAQGQAQMDWRMFGGGWRWRVMGFAEAPGYHKITPEKIQMQLDTEEIEMGTGGRDGEGGQESYWKGRG